MVRHQGFEPLNTNSMAPAVLHGSLRHCGYVSACVSTSCQYLVHGFLHMHHKRAKGLTVVLSTYQSLPTVAEAQKLGVDKFDLGICDEAHRTTGVTLADNDIVRRSCARQDGAGPADARRRGAAVAEDWITSGFDCVA